jgi:hypothetical protein
MADSSPADYPGLRQYLLGPSLLPLPLLWLLPLPRPFEFSSLHGVESPCLSLAGSGAATGAAFLLVIGAHRQSTEFASNINYRPPRARLWEATLRSTSLPLAPELPEEARVPIERS